MKRQTRKRTQKESGSRTEQVKTGNPELEQGRAIITKKGEQSGEDNIPEPTATKERISNRRREEVRTTERRDIWRRQGRPPKE